MENFNNSTLLVSLINFLFRYFEKNFNSFYLLFLLTNLIFFSKKNKEQLRFVLCALLNILCANQSRKKPKIIGILKTMSKVVIILPKKYQKLSLFKKSTLYLLKNMRSLDYGQQTHAKISIFKFKNRKLLLQAMNV